MKSDPIPRSSRDAGPYLARMVFAGGSGLADGAGRREQGVAVRGWHRMHCSPTSHFLTPTPSRASFDMGLDQQGRWSLHGAKIFASGWGLAVSGWRIADAASGTIDSALDAALRTLHSVSAGRADRPGRPGIRHADHQGRWSLPKEAIGASRRASAGFVRRGSAKQG